MVYLMLKINRFFVFIMSCLLLLGLAYALPSFEVKVVPIKDKIVVDEIAEFDIMIISNLETDHEFMLKKSGYPFWDMYTKPLQNPITLIVPGNKSASIRLFVDPLYITTVDTYTLDLGVILQSTGEEDKVPITVGIKSIEPLIGGYIPTVLGSVGIPEKIDPREDVKIKIVLNNQNVINYTNLTVKLESDLIKDVLHVPLLPNENKEIEITKKFDPMTPPQKDRLVVTALSGQRTIVNPIVKEFEIKQYATQQNLPKEQSFLKIRKGIKVSSNDLSFKATIKIETSSFQNLFMTTSPRADLVDENGRKYIVWQVSLGKDKSAVVYTIENYRPILVITVLIIVAIILYFLFRSPMVIRKEIANVGMSEGGISEAKIVVKIKNRSGKQLNEIEVMDNVSHIAHIEKELAIGSMQPHAVLMHPKKGMLIKWTIEALEPGDERVLSYKMKSRLPILGEFNLPAANARCKVDNKVVISNSNRVSLGG